MKICIATLDIVGPIRNGGIGTAYTQLALLLAQAGHEVTIAYLLGEQGEQGSLREWQRWYAERGIVFRPVRLDARLRLQGPPQRGDAYRTYIWLRELPERFDVVHFPEWRGYGYYAMLAKRLGLDFQDTTFCVGTHSPTLWHTLGNGVVVSELHQIDLHWLEAQSIALADLVVSPSRYMLDWIREQGWTLPERAMVLPNVMLDAPIPAERPGNAMVTELVFFGRLEERKGLGLFCDAMDRLAPTLDRQVEVTFLGKPGQIHGQPGPAFAAERAEAWGLPWRVITDLDRDAALAYLARPGRLAVIPSLIENSPYTVLECLAAGIPFLAAGIGGVPELVAEPDRARTCFVPTPPALARALGAALHDGVAAAGCAFDVAANNRRWLELHEELARRPAASMASPVVVEQPLVSVCLVHRNRPRFLEQAVRSLEAQDYPHFEVVLVDDGSDRPEALACLDRLEPAFERRGWRIVRQANRYLGAARNAAAAAARGDYLLFMDDDNIADPDELSTFVKAALASGADILTCVLRPFRGDHPGSGEHEPLWLPVGANLSLGLFENCFGDANALIRRACFEALGGFSEDFGVGHEDWELFARAVLRGFTLHVVPEPLFWYRVSDTGMLRSGHMVADFQRSLRPYLEAVPAALRDTLRLAHGSELQKLIAFLRRREEEESEAAAARLYLEELEQGIEWLEEQCRHKDKELQWFREQFRRKDEELDRIKSSLFWRMSRPIRYTKKKLRRNGAAMRD
ncbi:glycosyltransferase [Benzoatithermus flavus]|uniref:Glycosyltransferase n=1 Tax=Benzoatithermus flavus TaxID=3108223 RepID=A0ABU8XX58_9PROT